MRGEPGPGPSTSVRQAERLQLERASRRALTGRRPAGVGIGREGNELEEEEAAAEEEEVRRAAFGLMLLLWELTSQNNVGMFGHRFLLPYGRRQTQMELDAAPVRRSSPRRDMFC
jgi:hypothetical protein